MFRSHFFGSDPCGSAEYLKTITTVARTLVNGLPSGPYSGCSPAQLRAALPNSVAPTEGTTLELALEDLNTVITNSIAVWHPRVAAHLHTPVLNASLAAELLISALNQSMDSFDQAPAATVIEQQMICWICELSGLPATASGTFTAGGTQSNYMGLLLARDEFLSRRWQWCARSKGLPPESNRLRILCSDVAHFSVEKAAIQLGLGTDSVVRVPVDAEFRMSTSALQDCLADLRDRQLEAIAIVATAGTTDFGSIDALPEIARIASENKIWLHVDAAYGGALLLSETHRARLAGLSQANSVTIDFHKAFFQPISCSAFLVADADHFRFIRVHADYLNPEKRAAAGIPDLVTNSVLTTRRFDALKIWLSLNTLGQREFGRMIDRLLVLASFTAEQIMATECLELLHQPTLGCIIFRFVSKHNPEAVDEINRSIQTRLFNAGEAVLGQTVVGGHVYLKITISNPCTSTSELIELLRTIMTTGQLAQAETLALSGT